MEQNQLTTKADLSVLENNIIQKMSDLLKEKKFENRQWLKSKDVRRMLQCSPGTLQNLRINGTLPFTKVGGTIFYKYENVIQMLNDNKVNH